MHGCTFLKKRCGRKRRARITVKLFLSGTYESRTISVRLANKERMADKGGNKIMPSLK